jgi:hypothetical protein
MLSFSIVMLSLFIIMLTEEASLEVLQLRFASFRMTVRVSFSFYGG